MLRPRPPLLEPLGPDPGSSFRFLDRRVEAFGMRLHHHDLIELGCVWRGGITALVGDHVGNHEPPVAFLIGPGLPHTWMSRPGVPPPHRAWVLQFPAALPARLAGLPEAAGALAAVEGSRRGLALHGAPAARIAAALARWRRLEGPARLGLLLDCLHAFAGAAQPLAHRLAAVGDPASARRLAAVCAWLDEHAAAPVTLAGAARVAGMHPQALARAFRRHTGHSVIGWVQRVRIARACDLLRRGAEVAAAAEAVGLAGTAHFHRLFRRFMGTSPAAWRRACGGG